MEQRGMIDKLDELMGGAVTERYAHAMEQVVENILDPNCEPEKARKITLTITLKANKQRDVGEFSVEAKTTLVPRHAVKTTVLIGQEGGQIVAREYKKDVIPGQMDTDGKEAGSNVVPLAHLK